jgi:hypothetical protein
MIGIGERSYYYQLVVIASSLQESRIAMKFRNPVFLFFQPVDMADPFTKSHKKCILCQHGIEPDYKVISKERCSE